MLMNELSSASTEIVPLRQPERTIGAILIESGRLRREDVEEILWLQLKKGMRFGDAGHELGLLSRADVDFALALQFDYRYLRRGESRVSEEVIAAYDPFSSQVEALRALRSQLMLRWFDSDPARKALAVLSAGRNEGRSYIAANLAVVFSQLGQRTVLIDADLRNPCQHKLFALDERAGLSTVLSGRAGLEAVQRIPSLSHLSVLPAGVLPPNPQELVTRPAFAQLLRSLEPHVDVIILDSPAAAESADAQTLAVRAGAALLVARKNVTRMARAKHVADSVLHAKGTIVGAVYNDF
jgi:protein-tyrosine kinase